MCLSEVSPSLSVIMANVLCIEFYRETIMRQQDLRPPSLIVVATVLVDIPMELVLQSTSAWRHFQCKFQGDIGKKTISIWYYNTGGTSSVWAKLLLCF